jgi:hypothetical protein
LELLLAGQHTWRFNQIKGCSKRCKGRRPGATKAEQQPAAIPATAAVEVPNPWRRGLDGACDSSIQKDLGFLFSISFSYSYPDLNVFFLTSKIYPMARIT